ncbi:MAG: hypothetical protein EPN86_06465 [Nanoarchaeota archaeon]|nr:MAG: hypothetical protein EPN86_06465 [Nanoarchaeota archaeon]
MEKPITKPKEELSREELEHLPRKDKDAYLERYILKLLELNKEQGLNFSEVRQAVPYTSTPTLARYLETLAATRQIYKVRRGKNVEYYPNNRPLHPLINKTISSGNKKFKFQILEYDDGLQTYIQEINRDFLGREEVSGGILIPLNSVPIIAEYLLFLNKEKPKIIEEFRAEGIKKINRKIGGGVEA